MTDSTSQERFLQIGEAAERAQLTQRTLRYYEEKEAARAADADGRAGSGCTRRKTWSGSSESGS
ncbi:MerR family DNA-binding transcriptional regulator [Tepidiforma flava]|uniref:MerR family DNA-binding transcriptional regulator n=1 Tax=Tepidiforma flava TaxID=3004094 RepID=A0ABY7M5H3_9CHLR|nr:MerR family DNA-binding transcriptional regulator [Tepidiforma flava]WBL35218.1 MerR family DNA-binding transcriptional regulator [Tepidiforma flava]